MKKIRKDGHICYIQIHGENPDRILFWIAGTHELEYLENVYKTLSQQTNSSWILAICVVENWNADLSPWKADAVFGKEAFAGKGKQTLEWLTNSCIPFIYDEYHLNRLETVNLIGGYSLAGLFSLWAFHETKIFKGVASCSGSLWFPDMIDYVKAKMIPENSFIYLSLGTKEEKTKNPVMATVGDTTRSINTWYQANSKVYATTLEWNSGNHFTQPVLRITKGFTWLLNQNLFPGNLL